MFVWNEFPYRHWEIKLTSKIALECHIGVFAVSVVHQWSNTYSLQQTCVSDEQIFSLTPTPTCSTAVAEYSFELFQQRSGASQFSHKQKASPFTLPLQSDHDLISSNQISQVIM